jgi:mersacidin/lichenicidin family type 2 lantibiotic
MNIEEIIRAWKADEDDQNTNSVANPIGEELTDQELEMVTGGRNCCESYTGDGSRAG